MQLLPLANAVPELGILTHMANRHGLIAGATGTGKTYTLKLMAEAFSNAGVPVFMADVKGDLSGVAQAGELSDKLKKRLEDLGQPTPNFQAFPTVFWDVYGENGHPVRTTVSEMGPVIFSELLGLNDTQSGIVSIVFRVADEQGWLLIDLDDFRAVLNFVNENRSELQAAYGNVSPASVGAISRSLLTLEDQGGKLFFGEPALSLEDFLQVDQNGKGVVNLLAADKLVRAPKLYSSFLLWLLSELFESLPEVGDAQKPKLVFFFDEAHLLFDDINPALQDTLEQVVRLIRSKGVGVYFITQSPSDLPDAVLGQLGNRVQHALRAFTPKDQKALKAAAQTFRQNPEFDTSEAIAELGVGEALVSFLDEKGSPSVVQRAWMLAPGSKGGPLDSAQKTKLIQSSLVYGAYEEAVNRESAFELLEARSKAAEAAEQEALRAKEEEELAAKAEAQAQKEEIARLKKEAKEAEAKAKERAKLVNRVVGNFASSAARSLGSKSGQRLLRGLLGSLLKR